MGMSVKAIHKNAPISARKVRAFRSMLVGLPVVVARAQLKNTRNKSADVLSALLNSAIHNAIHNQKLEERDLVVTEMTADKGLVYKRARPRAKGSAYPYMKRTAHVMVVVAKREEK